MAPAIVAAQPNLPAPSAKRLATAGLLNDGLDRQGGQSLETPAVWRSNLRGDASLLGRRGKSWWTGVAPAACPGAQPDGTLTSLPLPVRGVAAGARARGAGGWELWFAYGALYGVPHSPRLPAAQAPGDG